MSGTVLLVTTSGEKRRSPPAAPPAICRQCPGLCRVPSTRRPQPLWPSLCHLGHDELSESLLLNSEGQVGTSRVASSVVFRRLCTEEEEYAPWAEAQYGSSYYKQETQRGRVTSEKSAARTQANPGYRQ